MRFSSIEYFIAVAEHGSLSRAANHLYITQPALSKQIKLFEKELGYKHFIRSHQGMTLTESGKLLYKDIQPILLALKNKIKEHSKIEKIRFGVSPFLATYYLPELEGENRIPIELTITREECFEFISMIELGEIDSAIVQDYPNHSGLFSKFLYEEEFKIVVPNGHPLTTKNSVTISECLKYPHVLPPIESRLYENVQSFIEEKGIHPEKLISVPYPLIIDYVSKGYGITYLPSLMIQDHHYHNLKFIRFKDKELIRKLYLFASSQRILDIVWNQLNNNSHI
ncbi:LysR family transcriptional regulator [Ureibacillus sp. Re31]|uniref:LysR family transcriptional regulator n=1 Tax=Ureibacillus galli TaxID=2762222 RepID=A0ABR8XF70_9BACL|nr:LysR family transcriptional regulator [Ureibacillus galli]MBD8027863.1 LysR family transcriptional regulator [Ureibacillus galli]